MEVAGRHREWRTKKSKQAKSKSKMLSTSTTEQERMKTALWWVTDFTQKKSTLTQASSLKENTKMSEPFQTRWKFTLLPAFQRSKFKWKKRLATVTNAWRVRNSKEVQHVVGKKSLSVMKLQILLMADLLFVSTFGLLVTMKVPGTLDKFSKLMNRMERLRFPSWPKAGERQRQAVSSGPLKKMSKERVFSVRYWGSRSCR